MTILEDLMYKEYIAISNKATISEAIQLMDQNHQGVLVLVDETNTPIGILSERNILEVLYQDIDQETLLVDYFTFKTPITINKKRSIDFALHMMIDSEVKRLVVVDDNGIFKGVITQDILVKNLEGNSFKTDILISSFLDNKKQLINLSYRHTIFDAIETMSKFNIGSIIALNEVGEAVGILTERDTVKIANKKIPTTESIESVMSHPVICTKYSTPLERVVDIMTTNKINRIIITDDDTNKPINIITMRDIANNIKGSYSQFLESRLKNIKNTLNFIDEYIIEVHEDNNEQIIQWMNHKATKKFGSFRDKAIETLIDNNKWPEIYEAIKNTGHCIKEKIKIDDMYFSFHCSYYFANQSETILLILQDITGLTNKIFDEQTKNRELARELEIVKNVIDQQCTIIFVTNGKEIVLTNKAFLDFFDVHNLHQFNQKYISLDNTFIAHHNFFTLEDKSLNWIEEISKLYTTDQAVSIMDYKNFEPKVFGVHMTKLNQKDDNYIITLKDVTEEKLESQKYYFNATHDPLTKIYNKSFLLDSLNIALWKTKRYHSKYTLMFFNIDNVKLINEKYGFIHGDTVITEIAKKVDHSTRNCDIFGRFSGEDFALILPETNLYKAELLAENLRKTIQTMKIDGIKDEQTASFGITEFLDIDNENTLLRRVTEALYQSKQSGKNKITSL